VEVRRLEDKEEIFGILQQDRLYAAYAIGDLESGLFEKCQWAAAYEDGKAKALCLLFKGLAPNAVFCMGESAGLAVILGSVLRPGRVFFAARPEHMPSLRAFYDLDPAETLIRMALTAAEFHPDEGRAVRLTSQDIHGLNTLYRMGGGTGFASYQVSQGAFYGILRDGKIVATAGTHVISPKYGIACVGNVFTHPDYRGHGYAAACTSAVVRDVLAAGCRDVVLNVRQDNSPAIQVYTRLGFTENSRYQEACATRKGSIRALLERLLTG
jgi:ribosomal protein S18 acetylase RimI-like enzyme